VKFSSFSAPTFHHVGFRIISRSLVVGFLNGETNSIVCEETGIINCLPKTTEDFEIHYQLPGNLEIARITCYPTPNLYGVPSTVCFRCAYTPEDIANYAAYGDNEIMFLPVIQIIFRHGPGVADPQMFAMDQLAREPEFESLHPLFLNQNIEHFPVVDPTSHLDIL
jgi:hypothetical protein